jgi:hypothetical protein
VCLISSASFLPSVFRSAFVLTADCDEGAPGIVDA